MTERPNNQDAEITGSMHPSEDELSAYINGDEVDDLEQLQEHLATCASCRETLSELRTVVWLLRSAESPVPSRSFRLEPSMVGVPAERIDPWIVRIQPVLRRITAIAAVFLLLVVAADVLVHQNAHENALPSVAYSSSAPQSSSGGIAAATAASALSVTNNSSAPEQPSAAAQDSAAAAAATEAAKASGGATPVAAGAAPVAPTSQAESAPLPSAFPVHSARTSYWRLVELAVGVVVIWLLFLTVALPRLVRQREP